MNDNYITYSSFKAQDSKGFVEFLKFLIEGASKSLGPLASVIFKIGNSEFAVSITELKNIVDILEKAESPLDIVFMPSRDEHVKYPAETEEDILKSSQELRRPLRMERLRGVKTLFESAVAKESIPGKTIQNYKTMLLIIDAILKDLEDE